MLTLTELTNCLQLTLTVDKDERQEILDKYCKRLDDDIVIELLESYLCNGWTLRNPEEVGALTDALIIESPDGILYWDSDYMINSTLIELLQNGVYTWERE